MHIQLTYALLNCPFFSILPPALVLITLPYHALPYTVVFFMDQHEHTTYKSTNLDTCCCRCWMTTFNGSMFHISMSSPSFMRPIELDSTQLDPLMQKPPWETHHSQTSLRNQVNTNLPGRNRVLAKQAYMVQPWWTQQERQK